MSKKRLDELEDKINDLEQKIQIKKIEDGVTKLQERADALNDLEVRENQHGITIYRQYFTYHLKNSRIMEVTRKFYLWVPGGADVWIYGLPGYVPSLQAKTGEGEEIPILSDHELNILFTNENADFVTQESLRDLYHEQIGVEPETDHVEVDNRHYVGLIIPPHDFDHFQEIIFQWTEQIQEEHLDHDKFSNYVIRRHTLEPTTEASTYVDISMDAKKYEMVSLPKISAVDTHGNPAEITNGQEYQKILSDKTQCVYRVRRHCPLTFNIEWSIGIPKFIRQWAWAGFLISVPVILYSLISFYFNTNLAADNSKLLAGLVAMIIGFRVLLFHDTELLSKWNYLYLTLLGISVALIILIQSIALIVT